MEKHLCDIYDSEELKIDSERSRELKGLLHHLCTATHKDVSLHLFQECFAAVNSDIKTKERSQERPYFKRIFLYQAHYPWQGALKEFPIHRAIYYL